MRRRSHCTSASNWDSKAWKFSHMNVSLMRAHVGTYPAEFFYSNSRPHKCRTRNYVSQLRLRMVRPWPDQPDRFRGLCLYAHTVVCTSALNHNCVNHVYSLASLCISRVSNLKYESVRIDSQAVVFIRANPGKKETTDRSGLHAFSFGIGAYFRKC